MSQSTALSTVGFIGLGTMGREMALNLMKAGMAVRVFDVRREVVEELGGLGAYAANSAADAAQGADAAITMLPNTPDVEAVVLGEQGLLANPPRGCLLIDMSTIAPVAARRMHAQCAAQGIEYVDAPVSGGPIGAKNATLTIMAGGTARAFEMALPFFKAMGTTVTHVGASGAGQTVKLCNQLICGINIQAICEALALGRASGVDLKQLREVLMGGSAASWMMDKLAPAMIDGDDSAGFRIDLMLKDLRLVQEQSHALNVPLPASSLVTNQYLDAVAHGEGRNGNQALFRVYDRMTDQTSC
ncbi:NAD(P)-dependent oxidoreductase [Paraburkholderia fungorum]|uniref:NAD(P)-dependent oxidoreductase n=1 Tax=Paraburkholderia fungorum TaxID=134537 RepID=UPI0038B90087